MSEQPRWLEVHDLVRWANASDVPSTRQIGRHPVARVLVQLAAHANRECDAWPSAQTLADQISGLSRWDVRNALTVLETAGLIKRNGLRGRAVVWRLVIDMAGMPATSDRVKPAGYPATSPAGDVAGEVAGDVAGYPATKRREVKRTPRAPRLSNRPGRPEDFGETRRTTIPGPTP